VLTLVLGGTKAGKSSFAMQLAESTGHPVTVLATGVPGDPEMQQRVAAHRRRRPSHWTVIEEPVEIGQVRLSEAEVVLFESVDSWLFNRLEREGGERANFTPELGARLVETCDSELAELAAGPHVIAVTAEVGLSLLPLSAYGRAFTDLLGLLNQRLAARADRRYLMVAGIPVSLDRPAIGPVE
jgi:adenosylcobinamide kinase/adenosylcobinamide-phosphate guanylyltransferase